MRAWLFVLIPLVCCTCNAAHPQPSRLELHVAKAYFLPGFEVSVGLLTRCLPECQLTLYRMCLLDLLPQHIDMWEEWLSTLDVSRLHPVFTRALGPRPSEQNIQLSVPLGTLPAGTYIVEATSDRYRQRCLLLVTRLLLIARFDEERTFLFALLRRGWDTC